MARLCQGLALARARPGDLRATLGRTGDWPRRARGLHLLGHPQLIETDLDHRFSSMDKSDRV